jgi:putative sterol carrier protein
MSEVIAAVMSAMSERLPQGFDRVACVAIPGEGALLLTSAGVRIADPETDRPDVTLTASADTFQAIHEGRLNPMAAYMSGKLKIDGSIGAAMKLASALA